MGVKVRGCKHIQVKSTIHMHTCLDVAGPCSHHERTFRHSICLYRVNINVIAIKARGRWA